MHDRDPNAGRDCPNRLRLPPPTPPVPGRPCRPRRSCRRPRRLQPAAPPLAPVPPAFPPRRRSPALPLAPALPALPPVPETAGGIRLVVAAARRAERRRAECGARVFEKPAPRQGVVVALHAVSMHTVFTDQKATPGRFRHQISSARSADPPRDDDYRVSEHAFSCLNRERITTTSHGFRSFSIPARRTRRSTPIPHDAVKKRSSARSRSTWRRQVSVGFHRPSWRVAKTEQTGWTAVDFDDSSWTAAVEDRK